MILTLERLSIVNFKGIQRLLFEPGSKDAKVFGENGEGKTTINDAFSWLLYGKNSIGEKKFDIKPIGVDGIVIPELVISVEGHFIADGKPLILKRTQFEKWTTRRGEKHKTFDGNVTECFFDDIPVSTGNFTKRIDEIISEDVFRMVTNLNHFPSLHWLKQREILFEICGSYTDEEVVNSSENLKGFMEMLNGKSLDDFKVMISKQIKKIKDEKKSIPIRVDEVDKSKPLLPHFSKLQLEEKIDELQLVIDETDISLNDIGVRNKENDKVISKINELKIKKNSIEMTEKNKISNGYNIIKRDFDNAVADIASEKRKIIRFENEISTIEKNIVKYEDINTKLRADYELLNKEVFAEPNRDDFVCTTCNQALPTDDIDSTINSMRLNFVNDINTKKSAIRTKGPENNKLIESYKSDITLLNQKIKSSNEQILIDEKIRDTKEKLLNIPVQEKTDFTDVEGWVTLDNEIVKLNDSLKEKEDSQVLFEFRKTTANSISDLKEEIKIFNDIEKADNRIAEIQASEQILIDKLLELENAEFQCEEFVRTKVDMVDARINSIFDFVRFKMFNKQVNGAMAETCEALINTNNRWVPYAAANTAGKINAGIDIINTISKHYNSTAPIFIDHNESVTKLIDTDAQIIGLYVQEGSKLEVVINE